jgi:hypothetical protein
MSQPPHGGERPPPRRRDTRRLAVSVLAAVLLVAGGGVGIYQLAQASFKPLDQSTIDSRRVAERFAHLFESARNEGEQGVTTPEIRAVLCAAEHDDLVTELAAQRRKEKTKTTTPSAGRGLRIQVKDVSVAGESGTVTITGEQGGRQVDQKFDLIKESGRWKVCGVYRGKPVAGRPTPGSTTPSQPTTTPSQPAPPTR